MPFITTSKLQNVILLKENEERKGRGICFLAGLCGMLTFRSAGPDMILSDTRLSFVHGMLLYFRSEQNILDNDWRKKACSEDVI